MHRSARIPLYLSSLLALLLTACSPALGYKFKGSETIGPSRAKAIFLPGKASLYKAKIKVYTKNYSGLVLLKQLNDGTAHLTFVTEIGMKIFDFEIKDNQLKLVYIFEPLNKPNIIRLLESDMRLILLQDLLNKEAGVYVKNDKYIYKTVPGERQYYSVDSLKTVSRIKTKGSIFTKRNVSYNYNTALENSRVLLKHKGLVRVKIELNRIANP